MIQPDENTQRKIEPTVEIKENGIYRAAALEAILGIATLRKLRNIGGLRAVGDWYTGQMVLGAFARAALSLGKSLCVSDGKVGKIEPRQKRKKNTSLEKSPNHGNLHGVSGEGGNDSLLSQLEETERAIRTQAVQRRQR